MADESSSIFHIAFQPRARSKYGQPIIGKFRGINSLHGSFFHARFCFRATAPRCTTSTRRPVLPNPRPPTCLQRFPLVRMSSCTPSFISLLSFFRKVHYIYIRIYIWMMCVGMYVSSGLVLTPVVPPRPGHPCGIPVSGQWKPLFEKLYVISGLITEGLSRSSREMRRFARFIGQPTRTTPSRLSLLASREDLANRVLCTIKTAHGYIRSDLCVIIVFLACDAITLEYGLISYFQFYNFHLKFDLYGYFGFRVIRSIVFR